MTEPTPQKTPPWKRAAIAVLLLAVGLAGLVALSTGAGHGVVRLSASHQWPGGRGDVRDEMIQMIAREVAAAGVGLQVRVYPGSSLYSPMEQWPAMIRGRLGITALPLAYMGGRHPEFNATLLPGLVRNHDHARRLNNSPFMKRIVQAAEDAGAVVLAHTWLAGGFGSTEGCILEPEDVRGLQIRAAGRSFELMLAEAGASISSMPSSEIYTGLQTGVLNATNTSSASFVSYRLYEQLRCVTPPGDFALWFMYQPIVISKRIFNELTEEQQEALREAGQKAEEYAYRAAIESDRNMVDTFRRHGVNVAFMSEEQFNQWRDIARRSSYEDFVRRTPGGRELLDLALAVE